MSATLISSPTVTRNPGNGGRWKTSNKTSRVLTAAKFSVFLPVFFNLVVIVVPYTIHVSYQNPASRRAKPGARTPYDFGRQRRWFVWSLCVNGNAAFGVRWEKRTWDMTLSSQLESTGLGHPSYSPIQSSRASRLRVFRAGRLFNMIGLQNDSVISLDDSSSQHNTRLPRIKACRHQPPLYQIDLSLPPQSRYTQICSDYKDEIAGLVSVYKEVLAYTPAPRLLGWLAKALLRKVCSKEESEEIRGIAKVTGMPLHLVVAYNTFLDLFSGCMSGGAKLSNSSKMVHFRNLDWGMEPLRDMVVRVEYVRDGDVVARAVTYAGYIGVLTGVREGLSISLNYRARVHSKSWTITNRLHQILLLLGKRPSIASQLREILLARDSPPTLDALSARFQRVKASPCYLTFCTPSSVLVIEKDLRSAVATLSDEFLAVTNHDIAMESWSPEQWKRVLDSGWISELDGARDLMEESIERKQRMCELWSAKERTTITDIKTWLRTYPIRNECTHFCCILDPAAEGGGMVWLETCEVVGHIG